MNERIDDSSPASCSTCRYYYRKTEQEHRAWIDEYGRKQEQTHETETRLCRRFPQHVGHYPGDWCGEYSPSNPTGLRCAGLDAHKQDPVVGQPELNNKANRPESEE